MSAMIAAVTWDDARTWISMFLAASAGWANLYGVYVWRGKPFVQLFYGTVAVFAWLYAIGYIWLIVSGDRLAWSNMFGNLGPIVWLLVWNIPPIAAARSRRAELEALKRSTLVLTRAMDLRKDTPPQ